MTLKLFQVIDRGEEGFCHSVVAKDKRSGLINVEKKVRELGEIPGHSYAMLVTSGRAGDGFVLSPPLLCERKPLPFRRGPIAKRFLILFRQLRFGMHGQV